MKRNDGKKQSRIRLWIQILAAALFNGYLIGFVKGKIFTGDSKAICLPVLNCYSCPGALGACPIGSLQSVISGYKHNFSFYVLGSIMLFGVLFGRLICGFLCPFGLIQDLLHKIPLPKLKIPSKPDKILRYTKYVILLVFVFLLPAVLTNAFGVGAPYFCKWICPAGILEGALPLVAQNEAVRSGLGALFDWKLGILTVVVLFSILIYRPFCKYVCPLGAMYGLLNRFSFYRLHVDKDRCIGCKLCETACKMNVSVTENANNPECIRCGACMEACPQHCISASLGMRDSKEKKELSQ
ncbi:MAG: 4Fe-4S binding protein [Candidatus Pelethousia sp.]|nr:4Fe-4S binding protein [Candidatus Pelethousia sp.]